MKTLSHKVDSEPPRNLRGLLAGVITTFLTFGPPPSAWSADLFWNGPFTDAAGQIAVTGQIPVLAGNGFWIAGTDFFSVVPEWSTTSPAASTPLSLWTDGNTAHFVGSNGGSVTLESPITAAGITFGPEASTFTINTNGNALVIGGAGIVNDSGHTQVIVNNAAGLTNSGITAGSTTFEGGATAGDVTIINNGVSSTGGGGGETAQVVVPEVIVPAISGGVTQFLGTSTAGTATIINNGSLLAGESGGITGFSNASTAGSATIINNGGAGAGTISGLTEFTDTSTAGTATIINNGGVVAGASGGVTEFLDASTAGNAIITTNGGSVAGATGGVTELLGTSTAGNATLITNGGTGGGGGGVTEFLGAADGGTARAITNGNGSFDISGLTTGGMGIGSIEGTGTYFLGSKTLTVGSNNLSTTVSGAIEDGGLAGGTGGSLTKVGTGTLTLAGANTYAGTTTVDAGTLVVSGSIDGAATTINGGSLILTGASASALTTVNAGNLIVDGTLGSALTTVNPGGLLAGSGFIGGSVVNGGIVSAGSPVGTLTVAGNYTQTPTGTLRLSLAPGATSLLAVGGTASLAGALQLVPLAGFQFRIGTTLTVLTAAGGVTGTFSTLNPFVAGTIVEGTLVYLTGSVALEAVQGSFTTVATTPNQLAVAHALDAAARDPRAAALIGFLDTQPLNLLARDLDLISPDELTAFNSLGVALTGVQVANVERRLGDVHAGSTGFNASGFTLNGRAPELSGAGLAGVSGPEGKGGPAVTAAPPPIPENRWGVFVSGLGEFTNIGSTANAAGFDVRTGGVTLGADYRLGNNFALGVLTGYAHTDVGLGRGGDLEADGGKLGLYATAFSSQGFYADASVIGGYTAYDSRRGALLGQARGSTDGGDLNVLVAGGYDWHRGALTVGPTAGFQYTWVNVGGFSEHGSLAPLRLEDQHADSYRTSLGAKVAYDWKVGGVLIKPELSAAWQHEFGQTQYAVVGSLAGGGGTAFGVTGPPVGHDSLLLGAGVSVLWTERLATYIDYDGEVGRANYEDNTITGGVRITF